VNDALNDSNLIIAMQDELNQFTRNDVGFTGRVFESRLPLDITNHFIRLELVRQFYASCLWVRFLRRI